MSPSLSPPESVLSLRSSPNPGCAFRRCRWNIRENMDIIVFMDIYLFIETIVFMDIYVFMDIIVFMDIYVFMDIIVFMNIILFFSAILPPPKKKYAQGLGPENMDIIVFWGAKENRSSCWFFFPKFWYAKDLTVVRGPSSINQENWTWVFSAIHFVDLLQNIRIIQNLTQNLTEVERNCWQI